MEINKADDIGEVSKKTLDLLDKVMPLTEEMSEQQKRQAWNAISGKAKNTGKTVMFRRKLIKIASAAAIIFAIAGTFLLQNNQKNARLVCIENTTESTLVHYFPDSSVAHLRAGSKIEYQASFLDNRNVSLSGEAYFSVRKRNKAPFLVHSEHAMIKVLGTEFNVKTLGDSSISLTVTEGRVAFSDSSGKSAAICSAGQSGRLAVTSKKPEIFNSADPNALAWKTNEFRFVAEPLTSVCQNLSDYYGSVFFVDSAVETRLLSGIIRNASREKMCSIISSTLSVDCQYSADSTQITFIPKPQ